MLRLSGSSNELCARGKGGKGGRRVAAGTNSGWLIMAITTDRFTIVVMDVPRSLRQRTLDPAALG